MPRCLCEEIKIRNKTIGENYPVYIIAEMACAHEGDLDKAKALIDISAEANVDAVQLQLFSVKDLMVPTHKVYNLLKRIEFSPSQWKELFNYSRRYDLAIFACSYDLPSATLAVQYGADAIKLNSSDLSNPEMIEFVAGSKLPFTLGTGASTLEEIATAVDIAIAAGGNKLILMHGVQNFPTDINNANIERVRLLKSKFGAIVGYQDHTDADLPFSKVVDLLAVGAGAAVIEKHVTLSRRNKGTDYQAALEPNELKKFVGYIRDASVAMRAGSNASVAESDQKYRLFQKKSIVATCRIRRGERITREKVAFLRSDKLPGILPINLNKVLGKIALRDIEKFEQILFSDIKG